MDINEEIGNGFEVDTGGAASFWGDDGGDDDAYERNTIVDDDDEFDFFGINSSLWMEEEEGGEEEEEEEKTGEAEEEEEEEEEYIFSDKGRGKGNVPIAPNEIVYTTDKNKFSIDYKNLGKFKRVKSKLSPQDKNLNEQNIIFTYGMIKRGNINDIMINNKLIQTFPWITSIIPIDSFSPETLARIYIYLLSIDANIVWNNKGATIVRTTGDILKQRIYDQVLNKLHLLVKF